MDEPKIKLVLVVEGGMIKNVYCDARVMKDAEVSIINYDTDVPEDEEQAVQEHYDIDHDCEFFKLL